MLANTEEALTKFGKGTIKQARTNLTKKDKNDTNNLYNKLAYELIVSPNSFQLDFKMPMYGHFQDQGVKGKDPKKVSPNAKITGQQAPNSQFKFGSGKSNKTFKDFVDKMEGWAKRKGLRFRDSKGRFAKGGYRAVAFVTARNIYFRGIKPSRFFSRAFETQFKRLPDNITEAFKLDVERLLKISTRQ